MKELSIEEKAIAYDKAIEKFDVILNLNTVKESGTIFADDVRKIFPELKESEDVLSALKKEIKWLEVEAKWDNIGGVSFDKVYAWLEKQAEQKSEEVDNLHNYLYGEQKPANSTMQEKAEIDSAFTQIMMKEQKPAEKQREQRPVIVLKFREGDTIRKKKTKDVVKVNKVDLQNQAYCYQGWDGAATIHSDFRFSEQDDWELELNTEWSEEDENRYKNLCEVIDDSEWNEASKNGFKLWFKSLKDRVQPQPKQEWSEEDSEHINSLIERLDGMCKEGATFTRTRFAVSEDIDWLKSLRPQNTWKPSDEQMEALRVAYEVGTANESWAMDKLKGLYQELKKLME